MMMHAFLPTHTMPDYCAARGVMTDPVRECGLSAGHPIHAVKAAPAKLTPAERGAGFVTVGPGVYLTPAHERTGISDRAAAALEDVAALRNTLLFDPEFYGPHFRNRLDRIEAALRERG